MLQIHQVRNEDGEPAHYSYTYFCDITKHGWNMAIAVMKDFVPMMIKEYEDKGKKLDFMHHISDRSSKDFSVSSLVVETNNIHYENKVDGAWNYTCPEEGKWLHDSSGGTVKTAGSDGRMHIEYNNGASPSEAWREYLSRHFEKERFMTKQKKKQKHIVKRSIFVIDPVKVIKRRSPANMTLVGITKYFTFIFSGKNRVKYREYACDCVPCLDHRYEECMRKDICGEWREKVWDEQLQESNASAPPLEQFDSASAQQRARTRSVAPPAPLPRVQGPQHSVQQTSSVSSGNLGVSYGPVPAVARRYHYDIQRHDPMRRVHE